MSEIIALKSFPFDSMKVLNEESGQMEPDRLYEAEIFRRYFAKFLSNGVYFGNYKNYGENSMKVIADGGMNIRVRKGAGIIEGADYENETERIFILERPISGNRIDRIVIRLDKTLAERNTYLLIKKGNGVTPSALQRDDNVYEICLAEVTVKSTANITQTDIVDKRINSSLCGIVSSLIAVDGEELYQRFKRYIDSINTFAVLNGNFKKLIYNEEETLHLNYPNGFNFRNCTIVSCSISNLSGVEQYHYLSPDENLDIFLNGDIGDKRKWSRKIIMKNEGIFLTVKNLNEDSAVFLSYKVVLLRNDI